MNKLFWQLPWGGPMKAEGDGPAWKVMPSPGMGDAVAVCVPVTVREQVVTLAVADRTRPIPLVPAPMDVWTTLVAEPGDGSGYLCLLGYDLPEGGVIENFVFIAGREASAADVDAALSKLQEHVPRLDKKVLPGPGPAIGITGPAALAMAAADGVEMALRPAATAPLPVSLTLAFASCQYPSGLMDGLPAQASLQRLADLLKRVDERRPQRLLMLGDQIYADATAGLLDPVRLDDRYRVPYEELAQIAPLKDIPNIHISWMLDDHEIVDNWEPDLTGSTAAIFAKGLAAYWKYQRGTLPLTETWYHMENPGSWHLFVADTRTLRPLRSEATLATANILGEKQTQDLEAWLLARPPEDLKLIACPAMLLPRLVEHLDEPLHLDGWQGYPASLERLLVFMCDNEISNVVFLSGDAHLGCDVRITLTRPDGKTVTTRSIHTPALYAPLPFANEQPWNLKLPDRFQFPGPLGQYTCDVQGAAFLPHRDGCCLLKADRAEAAWSVTVEVL